MVSPQAFSQPTDNKALDRLLAEPGGTHPAPCCYSELPRISSKIPEKLSEHFLGDDSDSAETAGQFRVSQQWHWGYSETPCK